MTISQRGQRTPPPAAPPPLPPPAELAADETAERVWAAVVARLAQVGVSEAAMDVWIKPITAIGVLEGALCVQGPQPVCRWFRRRYAALAGELVRDEGTFTGLRVYDRAEAARSEDRAL